MLCLGGSSSSTAFVNQSCWTRKGTNMSVNVTHPLTGISCPGQPQKNNPVLLSLFHQTLHLAECSQGDDIFLVFTKLRPVRQIEKHQNRSKALPHRKSCYMGFPLFRCINVGSLPYNMICGTIAAFPLHELFP